MMVSEQPAAPILFLPTISSGRAACLLEKLVLNVGERWGNEPVPVVSPISLLCPPAIVPYEVMFHLQKLFCTGQIQSVMWKTNADGIFLLWSWKISQDDGAVTFIY
jgi:hypothetical protein